MDLELGLDLFDSGDEDEASKSNMYQQKNSCVIKVEHPLWFLDKAESYSPERVKDLPTRETHTITKEEDEILRSVRSRGDHLYFQGKYRDAVAIYEALLPIIPGYNKSLRRQTQDSLARSHCRVGQYGRALAYAECLVLPPHAEDVPCWLLLVGIHRRLPGHQADMLVCQHQVVRLNSSAPALWMDLHCMYQRFASREGCAICSWPPAVAAARKTILINFPRLSLDSYSEIHICDIVAGCCLLYARHVLFSSLRSLESVPKQALQRSMQEIERQIEGFPDQELLERLKSALALHRPLRSIGDL